MVDADTIVGRDAISTLVEAIAASPEIVAVSGSIKVANRTSLLTYCQHLEYASGFNLERRLYEQIRFTPTVPGALGIFRRSALRRVGGLSLATVAEDTDLTLALQEGGAQVRFEPRATAYTEAPATVRQLGRQRFRWSYGTMQAFWKHREVLLATGDLGTRARSMYTYFFVFQVLMPALSPLADAIGLCLCITEPKAAVIACVVVWLVQTCLSALALSLDGESYLSLLVVPLFPFFYRQILSTAVVSSLVVAAAGLQVRWQPMARLGALGDLLSRRQASRGSTPSER
jgi:cellulose synthase/poly-beta-1,6-N-acetylglucosamine synthase-like glycosyltransferase